MSNSHTSAKLDLHLLVNCTKEIEMLKLQFFYDPIDVWMHEKKKKGCLSANGPSRHKLQVRTLITLYCDVSQSASQNITISKSTRYIWRAKPTLVLIMTCLRCNTLHIWFVNARQKISQCVYNSLSQCGHALSNNLCLTRLRHLRTSVLT